MTDRVLFIHGMFLTGRSWAPWAERFEKHGYACTAPSWPGRDGEPAMLRTSPPSLLRELTLTQVVEQFAVECKARAEKPVVIGHSMGGLVAQILTAILGMYFFYCAAPDQRRFFQATVIARVMFFTGVASLVVLGLAPSLLLLFGLVDLAGAAWTQFALRASRP